jgi:uncharacterized protein
MARLLPLKQRRVFVDSSAYLALLDRNDEHHQRAQATLAALADGRYRQFTTNVLIIEAHALMLAELGIAPASAFLRAVDDSHTVVVRVRAADEMRAKALLFQYADKDFSFTDAISFVVMERLDIRFAFTFDRHFSQYGFAVATADTR